MAAGNFVVVRRTISQTLVPYKEVEGKLIRRSSSKTSAQRPLGVGSGFGSATGFNSTNTGDRCGEYRKKSSSKQKPNIDVGLERSRSEICLRRKSSYFRETSLDAYEERREKGLIQAIPRRKERDATRRSTTRPQSDFFPEFFVNTKTNEVRKQQSSKSVPDDVAENPERRLGRSIATLKAEMLSLRKQDRELLQQLTTLSEHIKDLKELSKLQGGLFGSYEDAGELEEGSKRPAKEQQTKTQKKVISVTSANKMNSSREEKRKNSNENIRSSLTEKVQGKKVDGGIMGLEETSFEFNEEEVSRAPVQPALPAKSTKSSQSTVSCSVTRKSSYRLERKSVSCQFLDSDSTREKSKRRSIVEHSESTDSRPCPRVSEISDQSGKLNSRQKSLSLSQLKRVPMTVDASTSDSECSTSGCYGGSSTGSEPDLERSVVGASTSTDEGAERCVEDKVLEQELTSFKRPQIHDAIEAKNSGQFRKKIVSV